MAGDHSNSKINQASSLPANWNGLLNGPIFHESLSYPKVVKLIGEEITSPRPDGQEYHDLLLRACDDERDSCSSNHGAFYGRLSRAHVKETLKLLTGSRSFSSCEARDAQKKGKLS